jgi:hypothetical protein
MKAQLQVPRTRVRRSGVVAEVESARLMPGGRGLSGALPAPAVAEQI